MNHVGSIIEVVYMTDQEKLNEKRSSDRYCEIAHTTKSFICSIVHLFERARKERLTHEQMLDHRTKYVYNVISYQKLPNYARYQITGAWDACQIIAYRDNLVFCYPHPTTRVPTPAKEICDLGLIEELVKTGSDLEGAFYWKNEDGTFTHNWS